MSEVLMFDQAPRVMMVSLDDWRLQLLEHDTGDLEAFGDDAPKELVRRTIEAVGYEPPTDELYEAVCEEAAEIITRRFQNQQGEYR